MSKHYGVKSLLFGIYFVIIKIMPQTQDELPKNIKEKIERREKKKKPKIKVSGKRVFQLKKILRKI